jgi:outer membrane protein, multidrug efflux system
MISRLQPGPVVAALLAALVVVTSSCAPEAAMVTPPVAVPETFSTSGNTPAPQRWWQAFGDPNLNATVEQALADNLDLRVAWDRLDQAWATARQSGASLWPTLDGTASASETTTKVAGVNRRSTSAYRLGVVASYEVDLWGRVRAGVDAARLDVLAGSADLHASAMTVSAEVTGVWYELVTQEGQLRLLDEQVKTNEQYLEVITLKFRRGQGSATDVLQQRQLLESTRGNRILVASAIKVLEHQLAVLLGQAPGSMLVALPETLPPLPPLPETGLTTAWLRNRPDVRAAFVRVQAADRRVAAAIADQYPRLSLSVTAETSAEEVRDLFDNWLATLAANLAAPLFDAGRRQAEVDRTRAVTSERLNAYGQAVLTGLREVEDALAQEARQQQYVGSLKAQLDLSRKSTDQTRENYTKGATDFVRYLTTLLGHQRLERTHLAAEQDLVQFRINLYRALGGGWALPVPPRATVERRREAVDLSGRVERQRSGMTE